MYNTYCIFIQNFDIESDFRKIFITKLYFGFYRGIIIRHVHIENGTIVFVPTGLIYF